MKKRSMTAAVETLAFAARKIALVSGPRQCGKTTLARMLLRRRSIGGYHNWDEIEFRRTWTKHPSTLVPPSRGASIPLLVLDEIHKDRRWKRTLKGIHDTLRRPCDILVTGSARLNVYARGSDSLLGRQLAFRLHPFSIREMAGADVPSPDEALKALAARANRPSAAGERNLASLLAYGPFPEPLLAQDMRRARLWRRSREQLVIREDLRDLSRLPELARVEMLTAMLPERVGSLFSPSSLAWDLETSIPTIRRWLNYLKELYYIFEVRPFVRSIPRSLRRDGKVYLWDYSGIDNEAARFENLVAAHLLKACHFWTDTGEGVFDLYYLRDKLKREIDFLIVRDGAPWLPVEVKLSDTRVSENWAAFSPFLNCRLGLQLVRQPAWKEHRFGDRRVLVAGAAEALAYFA